MSKITAIFNPFEQGPEVTEPSSDLRHMRDLVLEAAGYGYELLYRLTDGAQTIVTKKATEAEYISKEAVDFEAPTYMTPEPQPKPELTPDETERAERLVAANQALAKAQETPTGNPFYDNGNAIL